MTSLPEKTELIVRAIIIEQEKLLVNTWNDGYSFLPGGKVKHGESLLNALDREIKEELHVSIHSARLIYLIENFFEQNNKSIHELGFYYLVHCDDLFPDQIANQVNPDDDELIFEFVTLNRLSSFDLRPVLIRDSLPDDYENHFDMAPYHLVSGKK